ncbi:N4-gp56 family major capsid protein [Paenibacillus kandeliae]|uniref:N4-gp56 family major capsid protein n=1 Tax=Paenibacillus kandeliae TaxID=3231269 RepID=UPI00345A4215
MATNIQSYNPTTGTNALTAEQHTFFVDEMLERLTPALQWTEYGQKKPIPKRKGATANFRRLNSLNVSTTALTEGVTPDGVDLNISAINATVKEYGNWTKISEFLDLTGYDPLMTEVAGLMGENAGESIDVITRDIVAAGTNVLYAGAKTSRATVTATDKITAADILLARRALRRAKVKPLDLPNGKKGYVALIPVDVATDLMQTSEWKESQVRNNTEDFKNGVIGMLYGIWFVEVDQPVTFAGAGASGANVYGTIFLGKGAYALPDIGGSMKPEIIVHPAGSGGISDPLNQFNTVAWKCAFTAVRLQELAILRYESSASA